MILDYFWAVFLFKSSVLPLSQSRPSPSPVQVPVPSKSQARPRTSPIQVQVPRGTNKSQECKTLAIKGKTFFLVVVVVMLDLHSHVGQCSLMWDSAVSCGTGQSNVGHSSLILDRVV